MVMNPVEMLLTATCAIALLVGFTLLAMGLCRMAARQHAAMDTAEAGARKERGV